VRYLGPSFGGINLEDIKAPECFIIEQRLRELMDIPVFHDDQHGTAIIAAAGCSTRCNSPGATSATTKLVINGAGAAGIACARADQGHGHAATRTSSSATPRASIYKGRTDGMNQWKSAHAIETSARTLRRRHGSAQMSFSVYRPRRALG
jgi:malate dehydrogenase (oxaloacetate-decarboxylating)(NADP+)